MHHADYFVSNDDSLVDLGSQNLRQQDSSNVADGRRFSADAHLQKKPTHRALPIGDARPLLVAQPPFQRSRSH